MTEDRFPLPLLILRITIGLAEENEAVLAALADYVGED